MIFVLNKFSRVVATASPGASMAVLLAIHVVVVAILALPEVNCVAISTAKSLGDLAWSQLSSPSPPTPAGEITIKVIAMWWNHLVEVELPRLRKGVDISDPIFAL